MFSAAACTTRLVSKKGSLSLLVSQRTSYLFRASIPTGNAATTSITSAGGAARSQIRNFISRPDPEILRSALKPLKTHWKSILGGLVVTTGVVQSIYGNEDNFYDKRFILECDPDDLADFYGSENFMVRRYKILIGMI
jgi:hypothetical protein